VTGSSRITALSLDETFGRGRRPEVEQERLVAIEDLLEENTFALPSGPEGPYHLVLGIADNRLVLHIKDENGQDLRIIGLAMGPFRRMVRDYRTICESYYNAIRTLSPSQIETIDMARRGMHNEGSELLRSRLDGKVDIDLHTARRLFTLLCALHMTA
jgi:uncharacterized protein (UPF0262 family)